MDGEKKQERVDDLHVLLRAADDRSLYVMNFFDKRLNQKVSVLTNLSLDEEGEVVYLPLASFLQGDPFRQMQPISNGEPYSVCANCRDRGFVVRRRDNRLHIDKCGECDRFSDNVEAEEFALNLLAGKDVF